MNRYLLIATPLLALGLQACERPAPTVVNNLPPAPVAVPGPPGPPGTPGTAGAPGTPGRTGTDTTVIVIPPAASAPN